MQLEHTSKRGVLVQRATFLGMPQHPSVCPRASTIEEAFGVLSVLWVSVLRGRLHVLPGMAAYGLGKLAYPNILLRPS